MTAVAGREEPIVALPKPLDQRRAQLATLEAFVERYARAEFTETIVPRLLLSRCGAMPQVEYSSFEPMLCIVMRGVKRVYDNARTYDYGSGTYLIVGMHLPLWREIVEAPCAGVTLMLDLKMLDALLLDDVTLAHDAHAAPLGVYELDDDLLGAVVRLVALLERPDEIAVLSPLFQREILFRLLKGDARAMLRQFASPASRLSRIRRAIDAMRNSLAEPLRVADLASIADVGFAVGYESASQFSREYRRAFGLPPARDSARVRRELARTKHDAL